MGPPTAQCTLSASQIKDFRACPTKWAWKAIAKVRAPPNASAALGSRVHKLLEEYLLGQRSTFDFADPDGAGEIAQSGVGNLPALDGRRFSVERHFLFQRGGVAYQGYVDLTVEPSAESRGIVIDHKTSSNIAAYAESSLSLMTEVQAQIYAFEFLESHPEEPAVDLLWNYYQTKRGRKSLPVLATVTREHAASQFARIAATGDEMAEILRTVSDPLELPKNTDHCDAYGGCPYRDKCHGTIDPHTTFARALAGLGKKGSTMGLRDDVAGASTETTSSAFDWEKALSETEGNGEPIPTPETPPAVNRQEKDSTVPIEGKPSEPIEPKSPEAIRFEERTKENEAQKRGRPPGSKNKPKADTSGPTRIRPVRLRGPSLAETSEEPLPPITEEELDKLTRVIGVLYINCAPLAIKAVDVASFLPELRGIVQAEAGLADYRFAEYGKGPGLLVAAMRTVLDTCVYLPHMTVDTRTPEGAILAATLRETSAMVVMGAA